MTRRYQVKTVGKSAFSLICEDDLAEAIRICRAIFGDRFEYIE